MSWNVLKRFSWRWIWISLSRRYSDAKYLLSYILKGANLVTTTFENYLLSLWWNLRCNVTENAKINQVLLLKEQVYKRAFNLRHKFYFDLIRLMFHVTIFVEVLLTFRSYVVTRNELCTSTSCYSSLNTTYWVNTCSQFENFDRLIITFVAHVLRVLFFVIVETNLEKF